MGLFQKACETFDAMIGSADYRSGKFPLAPIAHTVKQADIEITLDGFGNFMGARKRRPKPEYKKGVCVAEADPKIVMPVTEHSLARGGDAAQHPHYLCEQISFLDPENDDMHGAYVDQLAKWAAHAGLAKLDAILSYVRSGTVMQDLASVGIADLGRKSMVCWVVEGVGPDSGPCWTDRKLMDSLTVYHLDRLRDSGRAMDLCMVLGQRTMAAAFHAKGVVPAYGNAKLISSKSSKNNKFTFMGRFMTDDECFSVGYEASQKAHNALAWLVANQGVWFGGRVFLCWNPGGAQLPKVSDHLTRMFGLKPAATPSDYRRDLLDAFVRCKSAIPEDDGVVFAIFDAPSTGCLSTLYYSELPGRAYVERLYEWDSVCCAGNGSPDLRLFAQYSYGPRRDGDQDGSSPLCVQPLQRLVICRYEGRPFPFDILRRLVDNASCLAQYTGKRSFKGKGRAPREKLLLAACAAVRKYLYDMKGEVWDMTWDSETTDRSYLFGGLLAVADNIEEWALSRKGVDRETAAMRYQKSFVQRPLDTWRIIYENLGVYISALPKGAQRQRRGLIDELFGRLATRDGLNMPLEPAYLLGYHEMRNRLRRSKDSGNAEMVEDADGVDAEIDKEDV